MELGVAGEFGVVAAQDVAEVLPASKTFLQPSARLLLRTIFPILLVK